MLIHHHLGLGDHLICNGLVRHLADKQIIKLFCKHKNYDNVSYMYKDNPNIEILSVENDTEATNIGSQYQDYFRIGVALNANFPTNLTWDEIFYYQLGISYEISWKKFLINKPPSQNFVPSYRYSLVSNTDSTGRDRIDYDKINHDVIYTNNGGFFDNLDLIYGASEIHCINSSYIHLIDRMKIPNTIKLFYHKNFVKNPYSDFILRKNWKII